MKEKLKSWLRSPLLIIIVSTLLSYNFWYSYVKNSPTKQFKYDVDQYYCYLPAIFINKDLSFEFYNKYWLIKTPIETEVPKVTYGMSVMYLPAFLIGHTVANFSEKYKSDGYSYPYTIVNRFFSLFYLYLGLFILFKCLKLFGSKLAAYLSIIAIFFCSNLFFYGVILSEMTHSYQFTLFCIVLYQTFKWHTDFAPKRLYLLAIIVGLITLIRPTDGVILLFPLLYKVYNKQSLIDKWNLVKQFKRELFFSALLFSIPILPQLIYWKIYAGQWLFFSYGSNEGFFFDNPKILEVLFSFRNGLFIYSPLMLIAFVGLYQVYKKNKALFTPISIILVINIYLISCWWTWWFGGSFGCRAMVQYYAFLAFGFLYIFNNVFTNKIILSKIAVFLLVISLGTLNIIQSIQYKIGIIHYDGMNKETYKYVFGRLNLSAKDRTWVKNNLTNIDYKKAEKGDDQHEW